MLRYVIMVDMEQVTYGAARAILWSKGIDPNEDKDARENEATRVREFYFDFFDPLISSIQSKFSPDKYAYVRTIGYSSFYNREKLRVEFAQRQRDRISFVNSSKHSQTDCMLTLDLITLAQSGVVTDIAILSGDKDFVPAVKMARKLGIVVHNFHFTDTCSDELFQECDDRYEIVLKHWPANKQDTRPVEYDIIKRYNLIKASRKNNPGANDFTPTIS